MQIISSVINYGRETYRLQALTISETGTLAWSSGFPPNFMETESSSPPGR